ncbi:MAG: malate dehydrogenase [Spirochaetales bacterium]|nr:malate dehydrogenase [Spirochaetales bacterium]
MIPKIFIIGAGNVGSSSAAAIVLKSLGRVFLYDIVKDLAIGKALDINQATPYLNSDSQVTGCNDIKEMTDSDIIVITAGAPRRTGMKRKDLLIENIPIFNKIGKNIMKYSKNAKVIVVSNPVDALSWYLHTYFTGMEVLGLGCSLDSLRFKYFLAKSASVSVEVTQGIVIGTHSNKMVPLTEHANIGGIIASQLIPNSDMLEVVYNTINAGNIIVKKMKQTGSYYAASFVIAKIVESIVKDKREIFSLSVFCEGHYGFSDITLSLPVMVAKNGIEQILELELNKDEKEKLQICAEEVKSIVNGINI